MPARLVQTRVIMPPLLLCEWRPLGLCRAALTLTKARPRGEIPKPTDTAPPGLTLPLTSEVCCKRGQNKAFSKTGLMRLRPVWGRSLFVGVGPWWKNPEVSL